LKLKTIVLILMMVAAKVMKSEGGRMNALPQAHKRACGRYFLCLDDNDQWYLATTKSHECYASHDRPEDNAQYVSPLSHLQPIPASILTDVSPLHPANPTSAETRDFQPDRVQGQVDGENRPPEHAEVFPRPKELPVVLMG